MCRASGKDALRRNLLSYPRPRFEPNLVTNPDLAIAPPPDAPPWTLPFAECPFALIDCEMTGIVASRDELIEVAVERVVNGAVVGRFASLLRTRSPRIGPVGALGGIDGAALDAAPTFAEVAPRLVEILEGAVPVMHGVWREAPFLERAFAAAGIVHPMRPALDTVPLASRALHSRKYGLKPLCETLAIRGIRWHRASSDVGALRKIFARVSAALAPVNALDLWEVRAGNGPVRVRTSIARTLGERAGSSRSVRLVVRLPGRPEREIEAFVRWYRDPQVGLVSVGAADEPEVLRADRVLRVVG